MCSLIAAGCDKNDEQSNDSKKQQSSVSPSAPQAVKDNSETNTDTKTKKDLFSQCIWDFDDMDTFINVEGYEYTDFGYKFKLSAIGLGKQFPVQGYIRLVNISDYSEHSHIIYDTYNCYLPLNVNLSNGDFQKVDIKNELDNAIIPYVFSLQDIDDEIRNL